MIRTHTCGELKKANLGEKVILAGWVNSYRNLGALLFIDLRDTYGLTQLSFNSEQAENLFAEASKLRHEWVVKITGEVVARPDKMINKTMSTGEIEIKVESLEVLSEAGDLPFQINNEDKFGEVNEALRLQYRFLDLRRPKLQAMLTAKDKLITYLRNYFHEAGFREIQTPILANSSPEGARDFLIPSRLHPGKFYALPQAPQQFKQLLMVSGVDKYFQIAPCFRDEDVRADRHYGEFYQLDMEMSFVDQEDVFAIMEPLMKTVTEKFSQKKIINLDKNNNFVRLAWREAMTTYGSDKPDLRYNLPIKDVSELFTATDFALFKDQAVHAISIPADLSRKDTDELSDLAKKKKVALAVIKMENSEIKSALSKNISPEILTKIWDATGAKAGETVLVGAGAWRAVCSVMGACRDFGANKLNLKNNNQAAWCWIVDYPMFEPVEENSFAEKQGKKIDFGHNPFSMPQGGMEALENKNPLSIFAYQYDLVFNGYEISSGAVRNHRPDIMYKAFAIAGYDKSEVDQKFGALIKAFSFGAPPHAGNAPGIDRLLMVLNDWDSIRDIYAFPKDGNGRDALMDSPNEVAPEQLEELGIKSKK